MSNPPNAMVPLFPIKAVTAAMSPYTATINDHTILVDASAGAVTINLLPAAAMAGRMQIIKKIDAVTSNAVTVDPNGSETVDALLTQPITEQYAGLTCHSDGTAWWALHRQASAYGFPYTVDPGIVRSGDVKSMAGSNQCVYGRVQGSGPISKVGLHVLVSSGNVSVAAYRNSGAGRLSVPGTRLATSGAVTCPAVGYAEISLGSTQFIYPGDWLALSADNVTASFQAQLGLGGDSNIGLGRQFRQATAHPLPSTPSSLVATVGYTIVLVGVT